MVCECHGEPAYWNRDPRKKAGGFWYCAVKRRQLQRDQHDRERRAADKHAWFLRNAAALRRKELARQRKGVLEQLSQLQGEAETLGIQP